MESKKLTMFKTHKFQIITEGMVPSKYTLTVGLGSYGPVTLGRKGEAPRNISHKQADFLLSHSKAI